MTKQLHKLINVVKIQDLDPEPWSPRELMLVKVSAEGDKRAEIMQIAEIFRAKIVDVGRDALIDLQVTGEPDKLDAFVELLQPFGMVELVRTGTIAIGRGASEPTTGERPSGTMAVRS